MEKEKEKEKLDSIIAAQKVDIEKTKKMANKAIAKAQKKAIDIEERAKVQAKEDKSTQQITDQLINLRRNLKASVQSINSAWFKENKRCRFNFTNSKRVQAVQTLQTELRELSNLCKDDY